METQTNEPSPPQTAEDKSRRSAMMIVFLVVFIDLLGFGIVLPLLPRYAEDYIEPLGLSKLQSGIAIAVLYSTFSFMQFLFAPVWGRISDRVGRRPILLIGLAGSVVFYSLFGYASEITPRQESTAWTALLLLFLARSGAGIAGATIPTAQAVIADCTTKENRSRGMALIGIAFGIGFTFGPLIAWLGMTLFPEYRGGPGYLAAGLSLLALLYAIAKLPETRKPGIPGERRGWLSVGGLSDTLKTPTVGSLVLVFFLATFAFASFESTLSLLTKKVFDYGDRTNYLLFAFVGFVLVVAQGGFYRRLAKKKDDIELMKYGIGMMLVGMAGLAVVAGSWPSLWFFLLSLAVSVFGFAFVTPSVQALVSKRSDPARQGEVLGVNQSFAALARIVGPLAGLSLLPLGTVLPYALAAGLLVVVGLLAGRLQRV